MPSVEEYIAIAERHEPDVFPEPNTGCWLWSGCRTSKGYGMIAVPTAEKRQPPGISAHRVFYIWRHKTIPDGLVIDHLCMNKACVNPDHLEAVTSAENIRRAHVGVKHAKPRQCKRGHEYSVENTIPHKDGRLECRQCARIMKNAWQRVDRARRKAVALVWPTDGTHTRWEREEMGA